MELMGLMWVQRQVVGLRAITLEEPCKRLAGVHDAEKTSIVDQLLIWTK